MSIPLTTSVIEILISDESCTTHRIPMGTDDGNSSDAKENDLNTSHISSSDEDDIYDAAKAVEALNGKKFDEKEWYVGKAQKKSERELELKSRFEQTAKKGVDKFQGVNLYVKNLDGSLCASGGKDGVILLWDLAEGKKLYSLDVGSIIHALCFSPNRYWLCAATESSIKIWDLESKSIVVDLRVDLKQESEMAAEGTATQTNAGKTKGFTCSKDAKQNILCIEMIRRDPWKLKV